MGVRSFRGRRRTRRPAVVAMVAGLAAGVLPVLPAVPSAAASLLPTAPVDATLAPAFQAADPPASATGKEPDGLAAAEGQPVAVVEELIEEDVQARIDAIPEVQPDVYGEVRHEGDGEFEVVSSADPLYRPEADGSFTELDATVDETPAADGSLTAPDVLAPLVFGGAPGRLVSLEVAGSTVSVRAPELAVGEPTRVDDEVVTFGEVAPGVELRYVTTTGGVQEQLVLTSPDAPRSFRFVIDDPDGVLGAVERDAEGTWRFTGTGDDDQALLSIPPAFAYEADPDTLAPRPAPPRPSRSRRPRPSRSSRSTVASRWATPAGRGTTRRRAGARQVVADDHVPSVEARCQFQCELSS